ncbi:MAG TPA: hypothetical protein DCY79_14260 [Planctomycetaceae bacterium]|nr:hypothetical protein [Planctomycetaceae bacterium]
MICGVTTTYRHALRWIASLLAAVSPLAVRADALPPTLKALLDQTCTTCHQGSSAEGKLDLAVLPWQLAEQQNRNRWIQIYDRIAQREMPPAEVDFSDQQRQSLLALLKETLLKAEAAEIAAHGRGALRRLNREEYEQNIRDLLQLPALDIRDMLPEDREAHLFTKTTSALDMSRVQLAAYLDAAASALRQARVTTPQPVEATRYRAVGRRLFSSTSTFGQREAMFFARNNQAIDGQALAAKEDDPQIELALFRSAHWPYFGYPQGFVAKHSGAYRVRFSARAVLQKAGYQLQPAKRPVPMTFRARKPSGPDVSGDVRATGGWLDIQPTQDTYETIIRLRARETFEYSLLGLPVPLARNVDGGPPTYRYPPFPKEGQPGVAFQWLEVEGPLPPQSWPPPSHSVLFDDVQLPVPAAQEKQVARRLLRRFVQLAAREPVSEDVLQRYEQLVSTRLERQVPFEEALLAGYQAFLSSGHFLYLREPSDPSSRGVEHHAIAARLSHFLTNTRPDKTLAQYARQGKLKQATVLRSETDRLIQDPGFERFVTSFTDGWLNLRHIRRAEPDHRLYPEYRFDNYLIESMERETRAFFAALVQENLPVSTLVKADFVYANDRLAQHYHLPPISGSKLRKAPLPEGSPYGGLLTQAAILKVTAGSTSTSPVTRGAWVMERILGQPPPPPPSNVAAVEPDIRGAQTIRELLALHTTAESCAGCHARFDPIGFALENFDILGAWRTHYRGIEQGQPVTGIDRAGHDYAYTRADPVQASGKLRDGRTFENIHELKALLAEAPRVLARNLLRQLTVYATGTPVRFGDRTEIETMLDTCQPDGYRARDLIHAFVTSKIFLGQEALP